MNLQICSKCNEWNETAGQLCLIESLQETRKILVLGLQNSGKTGMLQGIKDGSIKKVLNLKATRGRCITSFIFNKRKYYVWDHGGVLRYRTRWLNNLKKLSGFDELIYIVNPLKEDKFKQSLRYLKKLIKNLYLKQLNQIYTTRPKLYIFLNKCDLCKSSKQIEECKREIIDLMDNLLRFAYSLVETSLFNFRKDKLREIVENDEYQSFGEKMAYLYEK
ncbi:MAG: ADP-ribosylation factor-like protein [Promethearchaeia archaeon]